MKRQLILFIALAFLLSAPIGASAMNHEKGEMEPKGHGHGGTMMEGDMIMLGEEMKDGVMAMAHLKDVKDAMAKMGMSETHHFMVMFMDKKTGKPIESGRVAVKIEGPSGKKSGPVKLMGMQGHFGADIALAEPGEYKFEVGTKLEDGEKRKFEFKYQMK